MKISGFFSPMTALLTIAASLAGCSRANLANSNVAAPVLASQVALPQTMTPQNLRGYGTVSAISRALAGGGSLTRIGCESEGKAQLLQAKYLSDLASLPGVQTVNAGAFSAREINGQSAIAALREGNDVLIFVATSRARLTQDLQTELRDKTGLVADSQVAVPMWLDRWDKFGFRFYYRPWEVPAGQTLATHDFVGEFDYARAQNRAGFVFWNPTTATDSAEGIMDTGWWDWAQAEAKKRALPVGINATANEPPTWLLNRYRDQTQLKMPAFTGNYHRLMSSYLGGQGSLSWNSPAIQDAELGLIQSSIRRFAADPNVTSFLEPHGELYHGKQDIFLEYGPVADAAYRRFLQEKYGSPAVVAQRWGVAVKSWDEVRVPQLASFAGWGPQALDLGGQWRVGYEELAGQEFGPEDYPEKQIQPAQAAPARWFAPDFDDSAWPQVAAPGDDVQFYTPKRPAVFRRKFLVPANWKTGDSRVWLYVWDLNLATDDRVSATLNGQSVGSSVVKFDTPHWGAFEVSAALRAGENSLALRLPQGYLGYRVYLSKTPPTQYPDLGAKLNAQWVDFADFTQWSRLQGARRGLEMIRQVDANRQITLMAPDAYTDGIAQLARDYGGNFHNTGWMGAFWGDYLPSIMRGAGLPTSVEPGAPAQNLTEFKKQLGRWQTEGVQGLDYFIHIGSIAWNPEIKAHFEANREQLSAMGKTHYARAQTAILYSSWGGQLTGYPWGLAPNTNLAGGYWNWNAGAVLRGHFPYDGLTPASFANGDAAKYRVIVDSNTSIMDEAMTSEIEKWVRAGGTFIALAQSGRHSPTEPNSWPIERLTGYRVSKIDRLTDDGSVSESGRLQAAPGQKVYGASWNGVRANGLHLERKAVDTRNLLLWEDGSIAAGLRPMGEGFVVQLGAKFSGAGIFDRVEPGGNSPETRQLRELLVSLLKWRGVAPEAGRLALENDFVMLRPAVSNNGLYDAWTLWNQSPDQTQTVTVELADGSQPPFAIDARDGKRTTLDNIALAPLETRVLLTPRADIAAAPLQWLELQRNWWRQSKGADSAPFALAPSRWALDLTGDWKFKTLGDAADATPMLGATFNDADWQTRKLGVWNARESSGHGVFRRTFTVPADWNDGRASLWMTSFWNTSFVEQGRIYLDGREIKPMNAGGLTGAEFDSLRPGSQHVLAVEARSAGALAGLRGSSWLAFEPAPAARLDLAGGWQPSVDALNYSAPIALPGAFNAQLLRRTATVDAQYRGRNAVLTVEDDSKLVGVLVNGHLVRRHHHLLGARWNLNVTPWIKFGAANEFQLVTFGGVKAGVVREVSLGFYDPKSYP